MPKRRHHDGGMLTIAQDDGHDVKVITSSKDDTLPRGRPKSGRLWKTTRENRHTEFKRDKHLKTSWTAKTKARAELKSLKKYEKELKDAKNKEIEAKKERIKQNKQKREELQKRAEIVEPIKNTAKIKRMKKKQLRMIEKR